MTRDIGFEKQNARMNKNLLHTNFKLKHSVDLPTSKSISNRLLVLQYLMNNSFELKGVSNADDSQIMQTILSQKELKGELNVKNAGTCFRFLTAVCAIGNKEVVLTGSEAMKKRPIKELVEPLRSLGVDIQYLEEEGFPPLKITGKKLKGGKVKVNAEISSQYVSALLLIAPFLENGLTIELIGEPKSESYTQMTISLLRKLGIEVLEKGKTILVSPVSENHKGQIEVEADWSSASYWYELIALSSLHSKLQINKLKIYSIQGDSIIKNIFKKLGVLTLEGSNGVEIVKATKPNIKDFEYNFSSIPDMVQTFVVTCVGLGINGKFNGISHLVYKETNRIEALKIEIAKLNYSLEMIDNDSFEIKKVDNLPKKITISTYHDHRMAMAFAPLVAVIEEVEIENSEVVIKSYPEFWEEFS